MGFQKKRFSAPDLTRTLRTRYKEGDHDVFDSIFKGDSEMTSAVRQKLRAYSKQGIVKVNGFYKLTTLGKEYQKTGAYFAVKLSELGLRISNIFSVGHSDGTITKMHKTLENCKIIKYGETALGILLKNELLKNGEGTSLTRTEKRRKILRNFRNNKTEQGKLGRRGRGRY